MQATTIDHVPPKACFPRGYWPSGFEFPACKTCNEGSAKYDQVFGLYSLILDFDESQEKREGALKRINQLISGVANNVPEALPPVWNALPVYKVGNILSPRAAAYSISTPQPLKDATRVIARKLVHALYYREVQRCLASCHKFTFGVYQPQRGGTENLTTYLNSLLPSNTTGVKPNIKNYGDRFRYSWGFKEDRDFFMFAAQFGHGLMVWCMSVGPGQSTPEGIMRWTHCGRGSLDGSKGADD